MAYQLVLSGNRVVAHGEDCFIACGGVVICPQTDTVYQNATIAACDTVPNDIDSVGYEYRTGQFAPCTLQGAQFTLLWENASPYSAFSAQTISISAKELNYDFFMLETFGRFDSSVNANAVQSTGSSGVSFIHPAGDGGFVRCFYYTRYNTYYQEYLKSYEIMSRPLKCSVDEADLTYNFIFDNAMMLATGGHEINNDIEKPLRIYGVRV